MRKMELVLLLIVLVLLLACATSGINPVVPETWFATVTPTP
jgi:uncharacterized membrane protein YjdF